MSAIGRCMGWLRSHAQFSAMLSANRDYVVLLFHPFAWAMHRQPIPPRGINLTVGPLTLSIYSVP